MNRQRVLVLANYDVGLYKFRKELLHELLGKGYEVYISLPFGDYVKNMEEMGCLFIDTQMERRGTNPVRDFKLFHKYIRIIKNIQPTIVLSYTIKPNIYGGMAAAKLGVPHIANVTGLGTAVENEGLLSKIVLFLYKYALRKSKVVFFQNNENKVFFEKKGIAVGRHKLLPGSGVNLKHFVFREYPTSDEVQFAYISRIMKDKGADEFFCAAQSLKQKHPWVRFHVCGFCEEAYESELEELQKNGIIEYHGMVEDIREVLKDVHCVVLPSYHEGLSNVLLESSASGRPIITTDVPGCRDAIEEQKSGFLVKVRDSRDLINKLEQFIELSYNEKCEMGIAARQFVEQHFDRKIVVDAYMNEIRNIDREW